MLFILNGLSNFSDCCLLSDEFKVKLYLNSKGIGIKSFNISLPTLSFSYDKNTLSTQKVVRNKLKKDIKILKHQILLNDKNKIKFNYLKLLICI